MRFLLKLFSESAAGALPAIWAKLPQSLIRGAGGGEKNAESMFLVEERTETAGTKGTYE